MANSNIWCYKVDAKVQTCMEKCIRCKHVYQFCLMSKPWVNPECVFTVFKSAVCSKKADLCFVVDSSGSINKADPGNWNRVKAFLKHVISRLQIGKDKTRVAIVLFSNIGRVHLKLNELDSISAINRRIDSLPYQNGNTNTSGGLYFMNKIIFQPTNGDRPKISNICIVITDGHSTRDKRLTVPYAQEARDHGVKILAIGITNKINMTELMRIASHPHERTIFNVDDFDKLNNALDNLVGEGCVRGKRVTHVTPL